jgi:hypothetical protein
MFESLLPIKIEANPGQDGRVDPCKLPKGEEGDALC